MLKTESISFLDRSMHSKTILLKKNTNLINEIRSYFLQTYQLYEKLFTVIREEKSFYTKPEPLRHPLIFYYGHTACVYTNKLYDAGIIKKRINEKYQQMFAVGVDEMDWDDLNECHYDWPSVADAFKYRQEVKKVVLQAINCCQDEEASWENKAWILMMGIEHERIHLQTSAVIIRRLPVKEVNPLVQWYHQCPVNQKQIAKIPTNSLVQVPAYREVWSRKRESAITYGWDNQFGNKTINVQAFKAASMLVSNGQYLQFVQNQGYDYLQYWTEEGKRWLSSVKIKHPIFWVKYNGTYKLRTIAQVIDMAWDWPVEVNNLEARAFCSWKNKNQNNEEKYYRLPTEDEYYAMRKSYEKDQTSWKYQEAGNINLEYWASASPVDMFKFGEMYDIIGNVWQHTITPIYPLEDFKVHPIYEDFTSPTFDERHDMIKGGSFISTGNLSLYHARYSFRRHFYQFAGFRYIQTDKQLEVDLHQECISDLNVENALKEHYSLKESYLVTSLETIIQFISKEQEKQRVNKKCLTVGCSVGRIPLSLGKIFQESIGIDYTTRYFQMSTRLKETGFLKFKDIDISLAQMNIDSTHTSLFQMNPENPDSNKINNCDYVVIDGHCVRKGEIFNIIDRICSVAKKVFVLIVINVENYNKVSRLIFDELKKKQQISYEYDHLESNGEIQIFRIYQKKEPEHE